MTVSNNPSVNINNFNYAFRWIESQPSRLVPIFFSTIKGVVTFPSSVWDRVKPFSADETGLVHNVKRLADQESAIVFDEAIEFLTAAITSPRYRYMREDILKILVKLNRTQLEMVFEKMIEVGVTSQHSDLLSRMIQKELKCVESRGEVAGLSDDKIALLAKVVSLEGHEELKQGVCRATGRYNVKIRYLERALKDYLDQDHPILKLSVFRDLSYETLCELSSWSDEDVETAMRNEVKRTLANQLKVKDPGLQHMLYSVVHEINRFFIHLIDLVVLISSQITVVGKIVKKNGDKIPDIIDVPLRLLICFAVLQYLLSTTLAAEVITKYAIAGTAAVSFGYGILALAILFPALSWLAMRYRPMPVTFDSAVNLTRKVREKKLESSQDFIPGSRRIEYNNFIELKFRGHTKFILYGDEGTEKDHYISRLAVRLAQDDLPKKLSDKELFVLDLSEISEIGEVLENFRKKFNNHKNEVIVCLKNAHVAWESKKGDAIEQVKQLGQEFPFVLITTTPEKRLSSGLRVLDGFQKHHCIPLSSEEHLKTITDILKDYAEERAPKWDEIPVEVLEHIVTESDKVEDDLEQPGKAISLLEDIFREQPVIGDPELLAGLQGDAHSAAESGEGKGKERKNDDEENVTMSGFFTKQASEQQVRIENRQELLVRLNDQVRKVKKLWRLRKLKHALEKDALDMALRMKSPDQNVKLQNKYTFLLIKRVVNPILTELIQEAEKDTEICVKVDEDSYSHTFMRPLIDRDRVDQVMKGLPQKETTFQTPMSDGSSLDKVVLIKDDIK